MELETTQDAIDKLAALVDIPAWLAKSGYKGNRSNSRRCPVANYLRDKTGSDHAVCILYVANLNNYEHGTVVNCPQNVKDFIERFDRGDFPELVEESHEV